MFKFRNLLIYWIAVWRQYFIKVFIQDALKTHSYLIFLCNMAHQKIQKSILEYKNSHILTKHNYIENNM